MASFALSSTEWLCKSTNGHCFKKEKRASPILIISIQEIYNQLGNIFGGADKTCSIFWHYYFIVQKIDQSQDCSIAFGLLLKWEGEVPEISQHKEFIYEFCPLLSTYVLILSFGTGETTAA